MDERDEFLKKNEREIKQFSWLQHTWRCKRTPNWRILQVLIITSFISIFSHIKFGIPLNNSQPSPRALSLFPLYPLPIRFIIWFHVSFVCRSHSHNTGSENESNMKPLKSNEKEKNMKPKNQV